MSITKAKKAVTLSLMLLIPSALQGFSPQAQAVESNDESAWRFISLADWHGAERYIMGERFDDFPDAVNENINTLKWMKKTHGGDLIILPGDSNGGHWDTPKFIKKFNSKLSAKESILQAGKLCYDGMIDTFEKGGYSNLLMAVGDHEVGDNPWPVGSDVSKYQAEFRYAFAQAFNYTKSTTHNDSYFKYTKKIGTANARPLGTKYQDTSYAYQHKNALFITLDVFHQEDYQTQIGEQGTVRGAVVGPHLQWMESVLSEARKDTSIKHIFVQSHLPVIYPVRKVSSSGMLIDNEMNSELWQMMRKYQVDIYFAGEVHANTVTKDPKSNLLQVVSRGNFFKNFQTIDITDTTINMSLYRHFGDKTSDGNYQTAGKLLIDKSSSKTVIQASDELALLEPKSRLLHFDFEQDYAQKDRPINGLAEKKKSFYLDGKRCDRTFANTGTFGRQYDALHCDVEVVKGTDGNAGQFNQDSRMSVFAMGPLQGHHAIAYELSFKTSSIENQILISTATIWGNDVKGALNLYLDDGQPVVAISKTKTLKLNTAKLNDNQWHTIKVSMPHNNSKLSDVIVAIDGKKVSSLLTNGDTNIRLNQAMRVAIGGKGYGHNAMKNVSAINFTGLIDNVSLWTQ